MLLHETVEAVVLVEDHDPVAGVAREDRRVIIGRDLRVLRAVAEAGDDGADRHVPNCHDVLPDLPVGRIRHVPARERLGQAHALAPVAVVGVVHLGRHDERPVGHPLVEVRHLVLSGQARPAVVPGQEVPPVQVAEGVVAAVLEHVQVRGLDGDGARVVELLVEGAGLASGVARGLVLGLLHDGAAAGEAARDEQEQNTEHGAHWALLWFGFVWVYCLKEAVSRSSLSIVVPSNVACCLTSCCLACQHPRQVKRRQTRFKEQAKITLYIK